MKTCIMGAVYSASADKLFVLLNSIRRNGYQGDVIIVAPENLKDALAFDCISLFAKNDVQLAIGPEMDIHFDRGRWAWYLPYIHKYDYVFCCDTTDVVVQSDLGGFWEDGLHVTEEAGNVGDEPTNTHYVRVAHGEAVFQRVKDMAAINGGTVWGDRDSMTDYCHRQMDAKYRGTDQGVLIGLVREGLISANIHLSRDAVWTLALEGYIGHGMPLLPLEYQFTDGKLATPDGHIPDVIHQYNRFPELVSNFREIYA